MAKVEERIVSWLKEKVNDAGSKGIIFGMSGGIDSSIVAVLCKKAFPNNTLGVMMPCNSDSLDLEHAKLVAEKFDIKHEVVNIKESFECILKDLKGVGEKGGNEKIAEANIKPRLRMISLYYFANKFNYLVAGTDNKTESLIGYFTKHGDGGVDILPISSLYKRDVRKLAKHLGISDEIITKPPSAGLWEGQTDEGEMGITYDELDAVLEKIEKGDTSDVDAAVLEKVKKMVAGSQHKRELPPVCELEVE